MTTMAKVIGVIRMTTMTRSLTSVTTASGLRIRIKLTRMRTTETATVMPAKIRIMIT